MRKYYFFIVSLLVCLYSYGQEPSGGFVEFSKANVGFVTIPMKLPEKGTLEFRVKPNSFFNYNAIFDNSLGGNDWEMWIYQDGRIGARIKNGSEKLIYSLSSDYLKSWFHIAFIWEKKDNGLVDYSLWINGDKKCFLIDQPWIDPGENFYFNGGNIGNHTGNCKGDNSFDEMRLWNMSLSSEQLSQVKGICLEESMVNDIEGLVWENLLLYYSCDEKSGDVLIDKTGKVEGSISGDYTRNYFYPCQISATVVPFGAGNVRGLGGFQTGDRVTLEALPKANCEFSHWSIGDKMVSQEASYSFSAQKGSMVYTAHFNVNSTNSFMGGDGSTADPYQIGTLEQLRLLSGESMFLGKSFILVNDIDASETKEWNEGKGFLPIGTKDSPFTGTFKGQGCSIKNLTINREDEIRVGLFGTTSNCNISDLILDNPIVNGKGYVGALVGFSQGILQNCNVIDAVVGSPLESEGYVGGLMGCLYSGCIENSNTTGSVNASSASAVGGLVGKNKGRVSFCFSLANVNGEKNVGGLIGYNISQNNYCYAAGKVTSGDETSTGGLIGYSIDKNQYSLFWDKNATGQNTSSGSPERNGLSTVDFSNKNRFVNWDFNNIWCMDKVGEVMRPILKKAQFVYWDQEFENVESGDVIQLRATSNSGRSVEYSSSDVKKASVKGDMLYVKEIGDVYIYASVRGDDFWKGTNSMQVVKKMLHITKKELQITISDLQQDYDSEEKTVSVTTVPKDIEVKVVYTKNGTNWGFVRDAGTYNVEVSSANPNYEGLANATLVISKGTPKIIWDQDLSHVKVGDEIPLVASSERFLIVDFKSESYDFVGLTEEFGNYRLRAFKAGEAEVTAYVQPDKNWNGAELSRTFNVQVPTAIGEENTQELEVVPNPVNDKATILNGHPGAEYRLFNLSGVVVKEGMVSSEKAIISLGELPKGIYFLKTLDEEEMRVIKVVKQ